MAKTASTSPRISAGRFSPRFIRADRNYNYAVRSSNENEPKKFTNKKSALKYAHGLMRESTFMVILYDVNGVNIEYQKRNLLGVIVKKEKNGINVL